MSAPLFPHEMHPAVELLWRLHAHKHGYPDKTYAVADWRREDWTRHLEAAGWTVTAEERIEHHCVVATAPTKTPECRGRGAARHSGQLPTAPTVPQLQGDTDG